MIADTSYLLALINPDDTHHKAARRRYEEEGAPEVQLPVLAEALKVVNYTARRRHGPERASREERIALRTIMDTFRIHIVPVRDIDLVLSIYEKHPELSLVDACGVADARHTGGVYTFDRVQERLAKRL
ncbi:MAG: PIN domain-containing protein [Euryarchaeota archaeon]|nr:PIN domain-containing protein [Euryarchaeota archaeon]